MKCPKCGEELEEGAAFCTNCGEKLAVICPKCGKNLKPGAKFCSSCGANLAELSKEAEKPIVCPNCGAELEPDEKFCNQCGTAIAADVPAEATPAKKEESARSISSEIRKLFNLDDTIGYQRSDAPQGTRKTNSVTRKNTSEWFCKCGNLVNKNPCPICGTYKKV